MSVDIGIIGLPQSGKTTIFNGLTRGKAEITSGVQHIGVVKVPEPRLAKLTDLLHPKKVVFAEVKYHDIGAAGKALSKDKGFGGEILALLNKTDALINVVRAFKDETIPHPEGSVDVNRDIAATNLELAFSDLAIIERRQERIEETLKGAKPPERPAILREKELILKIKTNLEKEIPIREMELTPEEVKIIANYQFLTAKPLLIVVNIGEEQLLQAASLENELKTRYSRPRCRVVTLCGKLEMELAQFEDTAAAEFRSGYGIKEAGLDLAIRLSYELLGLITFFTVASGEVRAWSIQKDTPAVKAAGKIHTDMERGFIRAEVIGFEELVKCGSITEAKHKGLLRLEGKNYIVQDGDVITFLFNV